MFCLLAEAGGGLVGIIRPKQRNTSINHGHEQKLGEYYAKCAENWRRRGSLSGLNSKFLVIRGSLWLIGRMTRPKNYFESICYKYISQCVEDEDMIFDAMAIALNSLPPKYYRDEQCMGSFLTNEKIEYFNLLAEQACKRAIHYVRINKRWKPHGDIN